MHSTLSMAAQLKRYKKIAKREQFIQRLSTEAMRPDGQAARKKRKQMWDTNYIPQVISSNDFSDKHNMKKTEAKSKQGNVKTIGNKTDMKINSYYSSKSGDNMPRELR